MSSGIKCQRIVERDGQRVRCGDTNTKLVRAPFTTERLVALFLAGGSLKHLIVELYLCPEHEKELKELKAIE